MRYEKRMVLTITMCLGFAGAAAAQMGMRTPQIPGEFKPVVGSGAQYEISTKKDPKMDMAYAIVGKETVDGADGYWMEIRMLSGKGEGMIMKELMVMTGETPSPKRMIMQMAGRPPMEMPMGMMSGMMRNMPKQTATGASQGHGMGEKVGTDTVTVPAGTFVCDHYRSHSEHGTADIWASTKIAPYGLVKMTSEDTTMVLEKVLTNETSQIKGEPQKMNFPGMDR
jgi:hypothetical protein